MCNWVFFFRLISLRGSGRSEFACYNRSNKSEPPHDKTNKMACAPSEDSDHPGHPPRLIRVFAVRMKKAWVLSYPLSAQRRHWSDWVDAQADLSLRWAHIPFCWFCHAAARLTLACRAFYGITRQENKWASSWETCLREFPTRSDSNWPAQLQKLARVLKFRL